MLLAVGVWTALAGSAEQQSQFRREAVWSIFYVNNWGQILGDVPYFAGEPPLLRHLWSLAVEEQFYLLWPVVMLLLLVGAVVTVLAAWGVVDFPTPIARMHAATKPATLGLVLVLSGAALLMPDSGAVVKLLLVAVLQFVTAPVGSHLVVSAGTGDADGEIVKTRECAGITMDTINTVVPQFTGTISQIPPMYSALKHQGERLYKLAREGVEVERKPRTVQIHELLLLSFHGDVFELEVACSKGTYIRTLAEDIARKLGSCAHLGALRRLNVEPFRESDMIGLDALAALAEAGKQDAALQPPDAGLADWPAVTLEGLAEQRFGHGNPVDGVSAPPGLVRVYGSGGLLGLGEVTADKLLKAKRLMNIAT